MLKESKWRRDVTLLAVLLAACSGDASSPAAPMPQVEQKVGEVRTDAAGWVEFTLGDAPLIITAPHGGLLAPSSLPDRTCAGCVTDNDDNIQDLARRVAAQFQARTGKRVHLVINLLRRAKFDANRELVEATGGNAALTPTWNAYQTFIETANSRIASSTGRGLLLDLHGHGHAIPRLELGYLISAASLRLSDQTLAATGAIGFSSIAQLARVAVDYPPPVSLLRGPNSLGAMFVRNGFPSVPSPSDPAPAVDDEYFTGAYTTQRHGSSAGGAVDAIQVEAFRVGARDTQANLDKYATAIVASALEFLSVHYGWAPATVVMAPDLFARSARATAAPAWWIVTGPRAAQ